jgi:hypothetical protein
VHPKFLLGAAEGHEEESRTTSRHRSSEVALFARGKRAKWRRVVINDAEPREGALKGENQAFEHCRSAA